jgi:sensor c-di-GMP phosphodiesterase-like protein
LGAIAEDFKTRGHRTFLRQNGRRYAQGFLYSRAVRAGEIADIAANVAAHPVALTA